MIVILAIRAYSSFLKDLGLFFHLDVTHKTAVRLSIAFLVFLYFTIQKNFEIIKPLIKEFNISKRFQMYCRFYH
jgi:hypothetical protein